MSGQNLNESSSIIYRSGLEISAVFLQTDVSTADISRTDQLTPKLSSWINTPIHLNPAPWRLHSITELTATRDLRKPWALPGCWTRWRWARRTPEAGWTASPPRWWATLRWWWTCRTARLSWTAHKDWKQSNTWWWKKRQWWNSST